MFIINFLFLCRLSSFPFSGLFRPLQRLSAQIFSDGFLEMGTMCVAHFYFFPHLYSLLKLTHSEQNITQLATCSSNLISIISSNGMTPPMGVPPYYMISYAVGQTPVTSYIGWGENNLTFTVTQPPGMFFSASFGSLVRLHCGMSCKLNNTI